MDLADILAEGSVLVCTDITRKSELIARVAETVANATGLDAGMVEATLNEREALGSTGLGNGIAVPHGKVSGLKGVVAVFVRLPRGIEFDALDDQPVDLVMALVAPVGFGADHLKALARVARLLRTESVVGALRAASTPRELYQALTKAVPAKAA